MKTYFFECGDKDKAIISTLLNKLVFSGEVVFTEEKLTESNAKNYSDAESVSVFVNSQVTKGVITAMPNLKFISTRSTGFDHVDLNVASEKEISVSNVPAYGSRTVAEFAFSLILGLSRKSFFAFRQVKDHGDYSISGFEGFNLQGKTLGIIGTGRIGQNLAQIAKGFDMHLLAFDAYPNKDLETKLGFKYVDLEELLLKSDVISLHVPSNKDTYHLINKQNINKIKSGAILVNTSRGEVVETEALLWALDNKILSGIGLDVIEGEKKLFSKTNESDTDAILAKELISRAEVIFTPHIAFFTKEAKQEILNTSVENVVGAELGKPVNLVK